MDQTTTRHYYHCTVNTSADCVVSLPEGSGSTQALLCNGQSLQKLQQAAPWDNGLSLSEPTQIRIPEPQHQTHAARYNQPCLRSGCWDAFSGCAFALYGAAVVRLSAGGDACGDVTVVAGHPTERPNGFEDVARFDHSYRIMSDGEGCLYVLTYWCVYRLQLPASWRSPLLGAAGPAAGSSTDNQHATSEQLQQQQREHLQQQQQVPQPADQSSASAGEVTVTTVYYGDLFRGSNRYGAYDALSHSLILCTHNTVHSLYLGESGTGLARKAPGATAGAAAAAGVSLMAGVGAAEGTTAATEDTLAPLLLADLQAAHPTIAPAVLAISGVAVDGEGSVWVTACKWEDDGYGAGGLGTLLYRLDPSGGLFPVAAGSAALRQGQFASPTILRNGSVAMVAINEFADEPDQLLLLHLELKPPPSLRRPLGICPGPSGSRISSGPGSQTHTLGSDLGALLARQPDGSADVEVEVGGQVFAAHRSVLAARSPYFRQRVDPGAGFADTEGSRLSLPDADSGVFAAVLRYMYTDSAGAVPPKLLQPLGELADRLLLPGLCAHVGQQLLWQVRPDNVVGLLLWAEQRRGSYGALLSGLKQWFLGHHAKGEGGWVLPDREVLQLMREGPEDLAMELLYHQRPDVRGCKRQRAE